MVVNARTVLHQWHCASLAFHRLSCLATYHIFARSAELHTVSEEQILAKTLFGTPVSATFFPGLAATKGGVNRSFCKISMFHPASEDEVDKSFEGASLLPSDMSETIQVILGLCLICAALWLGCHGVATTGAICIRGSLVFVIMENILHKNFVLNDSIPESIITAKLFLQNSWSSISRMNRSMKSARLLVPRRTVSPIHLSAENSSCHTLPSPCKSLHATPSECRNQTPRERSRLQPCRLAGNHRYFSKVRVFTERCRIR